MNTTTYTVNEAGARTLRDAKPMTFGLGRYVTANVTDDRVSVFVGMTLHYDGDMPEGIVNGSAEFYQWVRDAAAAGEAKFEKIYDAERIAQGTKNATVAGSNLAGTPVFVMQRQADARESDAAKFWNAFNALTPIEMQAYGTYRKYHIADARWAYATRNR